MHIPSIHSWDITKEEAIPLQKKLAQQTRLAHNIVTDYKRQKPKQVLNKN
jgi:hypothetical protein